MAVLNQVRAWPPDSLVNSWVDRSYLAYVRPVPRPLFFNVSGHVPPGTIATPHAHPCIALHGCLQGPITLATPSAEYRLDAGMFVMLSKDLRHCWKNPGRQTAATYILAVDTDHPGRWPAGSGVPECCGLLDRHLRACACFNTSCDDELGRAFWEAADLLMSERPRSQAASTGILWHLLGLVAERLTPAPTAEPSGQDIARQIRRLLMTRVNDRLSLGTIARELDVSPTSAKRSFRATYGCGIIGYFNELKIWQAKRMLSDRTLTVEQISRKLSFSSPAYFSQVFLARTGLTPTGYRNSQEEGEA